MIAVNSNSHELELFFIEQRGLFYCPTTAPNRKTGDGSVSYCNRIFFAYLTQDTELSPVLQYATSNRDKGTGHCLAIQDFR